MLNIEFKVIVMLPESTNTTHEQVALVVMLLIITIQLYSMKKSN